MVEPVKYSEGRKKALESLRIWLNHHYPQKPLEERDERFLNFREREKKLKQKANLLANKVAQKVKWRDKLSDNLTLDEEDNLKITNTIIECIEEALVLGDKVRIGDFGNFLTITRRGERTVIFQTQEDWQRELNAPLFINEIGLKRTMKKRKLARREV